MWERNRCVFRYQVKRWIDQAAKFAVGAVDGEFEEGEKGGGMGDFDSRRKPFEMIVWRRQQYHEQISSAFHRRRRDTISMSLRWVQNLQSVPSTESRASSAEGWRSAGSCWFLAGDSEVSYSSGPRVSVEQSKDVLQRDEFLCFLDASSGEV